MKKAQKFWLIFALLFLFTLFAWYNAAAERPAGISYLVHAHHFMAVTGLLFIFMQFVLSTKMKLIENGFGLDRMIRYHRNFGRIGLGLIFFHIITYLSFIWIQSGAITLVTFMWFGLTAFMGFTITAALAATYKKLGLAYEVWKNIHLANYVLFPVALIHVFNASRPGTPLYYIWIGFALGFAVIVLYKLFRFNQVRRSPYEVVEVRQEAQDIWSLFFKGQPLHYKPGQFMILQLLRDGKFSTAHPFTISSSPTRETLSVTPKELGDFTSTIKETKVGDQAFIDAPYGVFSFLNFDSPELVFIAGGIGITPIMSMLRYIYDKKINKKVTFFWGNKNESNLCFQNELEQMKKDMGNFQAVLVMSGQKDWDGEQGRINGKLIQKYLPDLSGKEFFICGPPPLTMAVISDLKSLDVPDKRIHHELFEL